MIRIIIQIEAILANYSKIICFTSKNVYTIEENARVSVRIIKVAVFPM